MEAPVFVTSTGFAGAELPSVLSIATIRTSTLTDIAQFTKFAFEKIRSMPALFEEVGCPTWVCARGTKPVITEEGISKLKDYATQREHMLLQLEPEQMSMYIEFAKKKWMPILREYISSITGMPSALPDQFMLNADGLSEAFKWIDDNAKLSNEEQQLAKIFYADMCLEYLSVSYLPDDPKEETSTQSPPLRTDTSYIG
jgi:hypothetical protein